MSEEITVIAGAVAAGSYVAAKLFGPTLDVMGSDLNKAYQKGRDKILQKAANKVIDSDDGKSANLRVARDVLWNGAVTTDEVCAEYFGGVLAASRSDDGQDDSTLHYLDVIKSLSSKQLHLHYCIYSAIQLNMIEAGVHLNAGLGSELRKHKLFASMVDANNVGLKPQEDLHVLERVGLIATYKYDNATLENGGNIYYFTASPSTFGVMLFAIAFNKFDAWRSFSHSSFGSFDDAKSLQFRAVSLEALAGGAGLKLAAEK
ncbi:MAG: hypothetical protein ACT6Q9_11365 [Polaromonas sp.]|uniref:hypothetical protein n=1 Tax=Polaromonas sp. TaxID=1869339 RepID=UPI0040356426